MYQRELETLLRQGKPPRALMLFGECDYLMEHYGDRVVEAIGGEPSVLKLFFHEYHFASAKSHLAEPGLFGDGNLLIVKSEKKIDKKELTALVELVEKNPSSAFLLHYFAPDAKEKSRIFSPKKGANFVRFFKPAPGEAAAMLQQEAQKRNVKIDGYALNQLLALQGGNLAMAVGELEKLAILEEPVGAKELGQLVFGYGEADLYHFVRDFLQKKPFQEHLEQLLLRGEEEIRILTSISNLITQLFMFYAGAKATGGIDSAAVLGYKLPPKLEQERGRLAISLDKERYRKILAALGESELAMKSAGGMDKYALLQSTLIKIQTKIL